MRILGDGSSEIEDHSDRRTLNSETLAGFPHTNTPGGTLSSTTLPAATMLPGPTSTPGARKACAAIHEPLRTVIGRVTRSNFGALKSCEPVQRKARWETQTFDSNVTGARLSRSTSSPIQ